MSQLVKDIFMYFGIACGCFYLVLGLWLLVQHIKDKLVNCMIKGVIDGLKIEHCGMPDSSGLPDRNVPMTIDGAWATVNIENYIESYLKIKGLIKEE